MKNILLVFLGGGLGSICRYSISLFLNPLIKNFPSGTFISNLAASFLIGFLFGFGQSRTHLTAFISPLLMTGFCGGFSTFSTFSFENYLFVKEHNYLYLALNIVINFTTCLIAIWAGVKVGVHKNI